ncbi:MAG: porin [Oligoflexales bacterium]
MLTLRRFGIVLGLVGAGSGFAQDAAGPKIGFMYKMEIDNSDDGITKEMADGTEKKTTKFDLKTFALVLNGKAAENVEYGIRYQLINASDESSLDYAWAKFNASENHGLLVGKAKAKVYGWEHANASPISFVTSVGLAQKPFGFADMVALENKYGWGSVALQFAQDQDGYYNAGVSKQPAILFEYTGDFGGVKPLFQYGAWDRAHSNIMTVGVGYGTEKINATLDYTIDTRNYENAAGSKAKDVYNTLAINADMKVTADLKPFIHYSTFAVKQDGTDTKVNSGMTDPDNDSTNNNDVAGAPHKDSEFDDNANRMALGVAHNCSGEAWTTYLMYQATTGKFAIAGSEKSATEGHIKLGVKGKF